MARQRLPARGSGLQSFQDHLGKHWSASLLLYYQILLVTHTYVFGLAAVYRMLCNEV